MIQEEKNAMKFPNLFRTIPLRHLTVQLESIDEEKTYAEVEEHFGVIPGVQHAGLDNPSRTLQIAYDPELVSEERLLEHLRKLPYQFTTLADKPSDESP